MGEVFGSLLEQAKRGNVPAAKLLLDRLTDDAPDLGMTLEDLVLASIGRSGGEPEDDGAVAAEGES